MDIDFNEVATTITERIKGLTPVRTGTLRRSIRYTVSEDGVLIYSDVDYAPFVNERVGFMSVTDGDKQRLIQALIGAAEQYLGD